MGSGRPRLRRLRRDRVGRIGRGRASQRGGGRSRPGARVAREGGGGRGRKEEGRKGDRERCRAPPPRGRSRGCKRSRWPGAGNAAGGGKAFSGAPSGDPPTGAVSAAAWVRDRGGSRAGGGAGEDPLSHLPRCRPPPPPPPPPLRLRCFGTGPGPRCLPPPPPPPPSSGEWGPSPPGAAGMVCGCV